MSSLTATVGGIVLCGGKSSRMGQPKMTLPFGDEVMLQRVVRIMKQVVSPIVVVAADHQDMPRLPHDVMVTRDEFEGVGPLGGIAAGLAELQNHVRTAYVTSCDVPLLNPEFIRKMISLMGDAEIVLPQEDEFYHPLAGVYSTTLSPKVRSLIQANRLRPLYLIEESNSKLIPVEQLRDVDPQLDSLLNINTPEDYQAVLSYTENVDLLSPLRSQEPLVPKKSEPVTENEPSATEAEPELEPESSKPPRNHPLTEETEVSPEEDDSPQVATAVESNPVSESEIELPEEEPELIEGEEQPVKETETESVSVTIEEQKTPDNSVKEPAGASSPEPLVKDEPEPILDDVRMKGFRQRTPVDNAQQWVKLNAKLCPSEVIPLGQATGRILASDVTAQIDVPGFDRSAMDGYALRAEETEGAGNYNPLTFRIIGRSMPGHPFTGHVSPGTCVRIMTGSPMPEGADAVLPAEFASESSGQVEVTSSVTPEKNLSRRGEDIAVGTELFATGRKLRAQDTGVMVSIGLADVAVVRKPRVRILVTGNELVPPGRDRSPYQIYDSNSVMLSGLIERDGGSMARTFYLPDRIPEIREAMTAPGADIVLVSGGSSVGDEDHAPMILKQIGELAVHGVAMRPSSPTGIGKIGETLIFLLPGNPVSCLSAYDFFAGPAIRKMGGHDVGWPHQTRQAVLTRKIVSAIGRTDYCRVKLNGNQLEPIALSGASILSSTSRADGFVIVPAELEGYAPGTEVMVYLYE